MQNKRNQSGFTLVELSIVLVIIGLITGGILVGQALIASARLQRVVSDFERYNAAFNTFRNRYNQLPGDTTVVTPFAGVVAGNGDGAIGLYLAAGTPFSDAATPGDNEIGDALAELSQAGLVPGSFDSQVVAAAVPLVGNSIPRLANGNGGFIIFTLNGNHYYRTGITTTTGAAPAGTIAAGVLALTPTDAQFISTKMGDGIPNVAGSVAVTSTNTLVRPVDSTINLNGQAKELATGMAGASCWDAATPATGGGSWLLVDPDFECNLLVRVSG